MVHMRRLHHHAVAAARRNNPAPSPTLYSILARGLDPLPTDVIPPFLGQAPSSLIAPFIPSIIPTIDPFPPVLPTTHNTDPPAPPKPTTVVSSNAGTKPPVETHLASPVLSTTSSVESGTRLTTSTAITSNSSLPSQAPTGVTQVVPPSSSTSVLNNNSNSSSNNNGPSSSQSPGTNTSSGSVAAGVVVGLIGACAMVVFLVFLVRRRQTKSRGGFDADDFRRSAVLMNDPPAHEGGATRGYNPRPPSMIERRVANSPAIAAVTYGNMYNGPPADNHNTANGPYNQAMLASGQMGNSGGSLDTQATITLSNPFLSAPPSPGSYATAGHSQSSLVTSNVPHIMKPPPGARRTSRPATGNDPGAANGFTFPPRQGSRPSTAERQRQQEQYVIQEQVPADDYVDLSRSSVSPFQAAQYEAISRKLNAEVPHSVDGADVASVMALSSLEYIDEAPPVPPKSPLESAAQEAATPSTESAGDAAPPVPSKSPFEDPAQETEKFRNSLRESYASHQTLDTPELLDFPIPPSPSVTITSRYRTDSWSHTLPELKFDSSSLGAEPSKGMGAGQKYPSSPLATVHATAGDEINETDSSSQNNVVLEQSTAEATPKIRPETLYDPEDAYGGI